MCSTAKINWPMKIRSVYGISEMATTRDIVTDVLLEGTGANVARVSVPVYVQAASSNSRDV